MVLHKGTATTNVKVHFLVDDTFGSPCVKITRKADKTWKLEHRNVYNISGKIATVQCSEYVIQL